MPTLHLLTFIHYSKNVTIRMAIYFMISNLAVIGSLKAFFSSYVYLSILTLSKDGQNSLFFYL